MNIQIAYSWWTILFCIIIAAGYAVLLYYKNRKDELKPLWRYILASVRFLFVFFILFLLLEPVVRTAKKRIEKPIIVIAQDNSQSLIISDNKNYIKDTLANKIDKLREELEKDYEVRTFTFGEHTTENNRLDYSEKRTNFSDLFDNLSTKLENRNVGAIILASDGLYNAGENPLYSYSSLGYPLYTIALGDTTPKKDLAINKINHNQYTFAGNIFSFETGIKASFCNNATSKLNVMHEGKIVYSQDIHIDKEHFFTSIPISLKAELPGLQRYTVSLTTLQGEISVNNNRQDFFIEVIDGRQKILLLYNAPHPDISALKQSITSSQRYEVDVQSAEEFSGKLDTYNSVILHQIPYNGKSYQQLLQNIENSHLPIFFIIGLSSDINSFNKLNTGLSIQQTGKQTNDAFPIVNNNFALFTLNESTVKMLQNYPPLTVCFGKYNTAENVQILLFQKILKVKSNYPLLCFSNNSGLKTAVLAGEGIWKWRLSEYAQTHGTKEFDELINKTIQLLSVHSDKKQFKRNSALLFDETQAIEMTAELYDDSYDPIADASISIDIKSSTNKIFSFDFSNIGTTYKLNTGLLPVGEYSYSANANYKGKKYTDKGKFIVAETNLESSDFVADHQMLNTLSIQNNGKMYTLDKSDQLTALLKNKKDNISIIHIDKGMYELINLKWIFFLLLGMMAFEWFLRKFMGNY